MNVEENDGDGGRPKMDDRKIYIGVVDARVGERCMCGGMGRENPDSWWKRNEEEEEVFLKKKKKRFSAF